MSKRNFYTLLQRYRSGQSTEREKRLVEEWFAMLDEEIPLRGDSENAEISEKIWQKIRDQQKSPAKSTTWISLYPRWVAASVILFLAASLLLYRQYTVEKPQQNQVLSQHQYRESDGERTTHINTSRETMKIPLPDGSEVSLSPGSSLEYLTEFDQSTREVFLNGKAFFDVASNPEKPFVVRSGQVAARVLGTSFWVDGGENQKTVEVSVVSGTVSVSHFKNVPNEGAAENKEIILTANQMVKYSPENQLFEKRLVEAPATIRHSGNQDAPVFVFEDAPLPEVTQQLEKNYGIEIFLENDALKTCLFNGDITDQPLFTKLSMLCASVNASYEIRGTRVIISGKGCSL